VIQVQPDGAIEAKDRHDCRADSDVVATRDEGEQRNEERVSAIESARKPDTRTRRIEAALTILKKADSGGGRPARSRHGD
jgi:hypothetical protein